MDFLHHPLVYSRGAENGAMAVALVSLSLTLVLEALGRASPSHERLRSLVRFAETKEQQQQKNNKKKRK